MKQQEESHKGSHIAFYVTAETYKFTAKTQFIV